MPKLLVDALTDITVRNAKPRPKAYKLVDGRGLYLLVRPNGSKLWQLKYRFAKLDAAGDRPALADDRLPRRIVERVASLGPYPDIGLKRAREKAAEARELVRQGIDPVQHGRTERERRIEESLLTFEAVATEWLAKQAKGKRWTDAHAEQTRQSLETYIFPKVGKRSVHDLSTRDIVRVLDPLSAAGKLETLRRLRQRIGAVFAYAVQTGRLTDNPVLHMTGAFAAPSRTHFTSLRPGDLGPFLRALDAYGGHPTTKAIILMILLTACRTGEIRGAEWSEFDLDSAIWAIPAERMKKRRPHVVPLPRQAVELVKSLREFNNETLVFPSPGKPDQHASENVVLQALSKMGYKGKATGHGLRATVATGLEEMGFPIGIVKAQLSHAKDNQTDAAYLRGVHLDARREMMQKWADALDAMKRGAEIHELRSKTVA